MRQLSQQCAVFKAVLSDPRVIEIPKFIWWIILNLFVLPFRPKRVAHAYASVWSSDSPMREIVFEQTQRVQAYLERENKQFDLTVLPAMTYGNPGIDAVLENCRLIHKSMSFYCLYFPNILRHRLLHYMMLLLSGFLLSEICRV